MTDRKTFIRMAGGAAALSLAGCRGLATGGGREPVRLRKLGTFDLFVVEANPIVFRGKLWLMEYIRWMDSNLKYRYNDIGRSYFRFVDMADMRMVAPPFGQGLHMGNAFVNGDRVFVTAVDRWGGSRFYGMESDDLVHWTRPQVILENPIWEGYNTTLCRGDGRYVLSFELGAPKNLVGEKFTMFFAESTDLATWRLIDGACMGSDRYTGAPMLRYHGGWYYYFHLEGDYDNGFKTVVCRSHDLRTWTLSPHPVLVPDAGDRLMHPLPTVPFSDAERVRIAQAKDINASDLDMCEFKGRLVCFYSWGDQMGNEFSALAEASCTEREFCESFFD